MDKEDRDLSSDICEEICLRDAEEDDRASKLKAALALLCQCSDVHPRFTEYGSSGRTLPGNGKGYGLLHIAVLRGMPDVCDMVLKCAERLGLLPYTAS